MKREIKFRGYHAEKGWVIGDQKWLASIYEICDNSLIGQYTGMKDEFGKEIYEGDIVQFEIIGIDCKGEVVFLDGAWQIVYHDQMLGHRAFLYAFNGKCKIVGNTLEKDNGQQQ